MLAVDGYMFIASICAASASRSYSQLALPDNADNVLLASWLAYNGNGTPTDDFSMTSRETDTNSAMGINLSTANAVDGTNNQGFTGDVGSNEFSQIVVGIQNTKLGGTYANSLQVISDVVG